MNTNDHTKLVELLKQFSTAMLITHESDHRLRARPMAIADVEESGKIWFLSGDATAKVHEIIRDTHVHLALQKERSIYLSINGRATLVHDREKVRELWKDSFSEWFPEGKEDPELVLIAVDPTDAEYWDNQNWKKVKHAIQAAAAFVTRKGVEKEDEAEDKHGVLQM